MSFSFVPKTEAEVQAENLCPQGLQPFTVLESGEVTSKKSGKAMVKLKVAVHGDAGSDYHIYDYISPNFMSFKFRHFFFAVGLGSQYESGQIDVAQDALKGRTGWCDVVTEPANNGYPAKSKIADYSENNGPERKQPLEQKAPIVPAGIQTRQPAAPGEDDDVPF